MANKEELESQIRALKADNAYLTKRNKELYTLIEGIVGKVAEVDPLLICTTCESIIPD